MRSVKGALWVGAATAGLLSYPCLAQNAGSAPLEKKSGQLEDIIVTAQKRSESVQTVPVAVTALTAETLAERQITEASQLPRLAPSLQQQSINSQVGAVNFSIRGVGTAVYGPQVEASVATVIDDVVMARPALGVVQFFDLDRVEVLRGPQGMLFGKNASAGLINIVTARPRLGELSALANLTYAHRDTNLNGNEIMLQGALNLPVSANSAVRVSGFYTHQDAFIKNVFKDESLGLDEYGVRLKYLWAPTDDLEIYVAGDYAHENGPGGSVFSRRASSPGGFAEAQNALVGIVPSPSNVEMAGEGATRNKFDIGGVQSNMTYRFGDGFSLSNIAAYRSLRDSSALDTDLLPISLFSGNTPQRRYWQISDELRLASPTGGRIEYQLGLFALGFRGVDQNNQFANLEPLFPPPPPGQFTIHQRPRIAAKARSYAAFAEGKLALTDRLRLFGGGRFTHDTLDYKISLVNLGLISILPDYEMAKGTTNDNFSYRVGVQYSFTPAINVYGTYARGYKGPAFDQVTVAKVGPEIPTSLELGFKSTLFDSRLILNLALFHTDFKGYQAQVAVPAGGGTVQFLTVNAGNLVSKGAEVEFKALPAKGLSLNGGAMYNDAKYKNYGGVPCYAGAPTGSSGSNVCLPNGTIDVSGNQLTNAPRWTATGLVRYEHSVGTGWNGFMQADYYYRTSINYYPTKDPATRVGPVGILGAAVGIESEDSRYRVTLFGRNLLDKRVPTFIFADPTAGLVGDAGGTWQQFDSSSFRQIGISLNYKM